MSKLAEWLSTEGAHHDVVEWAERFGADWESAWRECPRADWMLGIAARLGVERRAIVLAAAGCARTSFDQLPPDESRAEAAVAAAEAWASGQESTERCAELAEELDRLQAPDPGAAAAIAAAHATLVAIDDPGAAPAAAANAAQAAMFGAAECAMLSLLSYAQHACAERVREHIPVGTILSLKPTA